MKLQLRNILFQIDADCTEGNSGTKKNVLHIEAAACRKSTGKGSGANRHYPSWPLTAVTLVVHSKFETSELGA